MPSIAALIMAGGSGERMRTSGVDRPKPLVEVAGRSLLELNVLALLAQGITDITIAAPGAIPAVGDYAKAHLVPLAAKAGGSVRLYLEAMPLGNIGAAGLLAGAAEKVLVVYADNLTDLDLQAVLDHHRREAAALTLACHDHLFPIPYGRLVLDGDRVLAYDEKPVLPVTVCSAISVLGPVALAALARDRPTGLVDLTRALLAAGHRVAAFRHSADWVDVNTAADIVVAEALVARHPRLYPAVAPSGG